MSFIIEKSTVDDFNDMLFRRGNYNSRKNILRGEISELRDQLRIKIKEFAELPLFDNTLIDKEQLQAFCDMYSFVKMYTGNCFALRTQNQTISFHCRRGDIRGNNDDIVYVTSPLYGFTVNYLMTGNISISTYRCSTALLRQIAGITEKITECAYGHPHATLSNSGSEYASICQGNNRFMDEYRAFLTNPDPNEFMALLHKAVTWLTTANLSDMYDTQLYSKIELDSWFYTQEAREFSEWLFTWMQTAYDKNSFVAQALSDSLPENCDNTKHIIVHDIKCFLDSAVLSVRYKELVLFHHAYALFLATHPTLLGPQRRSLANAVRTDVLSFHNLSLKMDGLHSDEWYRVAESIFHAPAEMKLYLKTVAAVNDPVLDLVQDLPRR